MVSRPFHQYPVLLVCVFFHIRPSTYVTIICDVFFKSWDDLVTLFFSDSNETHSHEVTSLYREDWGILLHFSKSFDVPRMLEVSAAQVGQKVSVAWHISLFLFVSVDAYFCFVSCV